MAPSKHKKGESCRLPWMFLRPGRRWTCPVCGGRFVYQVSEGTDRYGRKIKGVASWRQWGG